MFEITEILKTLNSEQDQKTFGNLNILQKELFPFTGFKKPCMEKTMSVYL